MRRSPVTFDDDVIDLDRLDRAEVGRYQHRDGSAFTVSVVRDPSDGTLRLAIEQHDLHGPVRAFAFAPHALRWLRDSVDCGKAAIEFRLAKEVEVQRLLADPTLGGTVDPTLRLVQPDA